MNRILGAAFAACLFATSAYAQSQQPGGWMLPTGSASSSGGAGGVTVGAAITGTCPNGDVVFSNSGLIGCEVGSGTGTVTSVSASDGLFSVGTPTTTPALSVAGTSGGVPYFNSASTWASSGVLSANALLVGGGAGVAPSTVTTNATVLTALGAAPTGSGGIVLATSPALVTPALGAATGTSLALGGATLPTNATLALDYSPGANTATPGAAVINANVAAAASQQEACALLSGQGWATTPVASQPVLWQLCDVPVQGAANPAAGFTLAYQINGGTKTTVYDYGVTNAGVTTITGGNLFLASGSYYVANNAGGFNFRNGNTTVTSPANATVQFGQADAAAAIAQTINFQNVAAGASNVNGQAATFNGSRSTGTGTSGDIIFQTGGTGAGAAVQNAAVAALTIKGATQAVQLNSATYASCGGFSSNSSGTLACGIGPSALTVGTGGTVTGSQGYYVCTTTCSITLPTPAAGDQFCVRNDSAVTTVITIAAITSVQFEKTTYNGYGTVTTGTMVSGGALGDKICLIGRDATHYLVGSFVGTWTNS